MNSEKPVIGDTNCPVCGKNCIVKKNKNDCGYFHCTGCFNGVFSKAKTREIFLTPKPDYSEPNHATNEPTAVNIPEPTVTATTEPERAKPAGFGNSFFDD